MANLYLALAFDTEADRIDTAQSWLALGERLLASIDEPVQVSVPQVAWGMGARSPARVLETLVELGTEVAAPAVIVVPVSLGEDRLVADADDRVVVVGAGRQNEWWNVEELWPAIVRALFASVLAVTGCDRDTCFFHRLRCGPDPRVPPTEICDNCSAAVPETCRGAAEGVLDWLERNAARGVSAEQLARVSPRRFRNLSAGMREDALRVDTSVVMAYAEESLGETLPDDLWEAGNVVAREALSMWGELPEEFRGELASLSSRIRDLDALSYLTSKRHREHGNHIINTGLLGHLLLDAQLPRGRKVREAVALAAGAPNRLEQAHAAMWTAAMWHDAGYTANRYLEIVSRTQTEPPHVHSRLLDLGGFLFADSLVSWDRLQPIVVPGAGRRIADVAIGEVDCLLRTCFLGTARWPSAAKFLEHLQNPAEPDAAWHVFNHGVWSLWLLCCALEDAHHPVTVVKHDPLWALACDAILFHDMPPGNYVQNADGHVLFSDSPLLVLLKLCDVAQDWDRRVFGRAGMVSELESVRLRGVSWRLSPPALLSGDITLVLEYLQAKDILDAEWQYEAAVRGLAERLSPIRFPQDDVWRGGPRHVSFRITSPSFPPEVADRIVGR